MVDYDEEIYEVSVKQLEVIERMERILEQSEDELSQIRILLFIGVICIPIAVLFYLNSL